MPVSAVRTDVDAQSYIPDCWYEHEDSRQRCCRLPHADRREDDKCTADCGCSFGKRLWVLEQESDARRGANGKGCALCQARSAAEVANIRKVAGNHWQWSASRGMDAVQVSCCPVVCVCSCRTQASVYMAVHCAQCRSQAHVQFLSSSTLQMKVIEATNGVFPAWALQGTIWGQIRTYMRQAQPTSACIQDAPTGSTHLT
jgi:hypothetical protein